MAAGIALQGALLAGTADGEGTVHLHGAGVRHELSKEYRSRMSKDPTSFDSLVAHTTDQNPSVMLGIFVLKSQNFKNFSLEFSHF